MYRGVSQGWVTGVIYCITTLPRAESRCITGVTHSITTAPRTVGDAASSSSSFALFTDSYKNSTMIYSSLNESLSSVYTNHCQVFIAKLLLELATSPNVRGTMVIQYKKQFVTSVQRLNVKTHTVCCCPYFFTILSLPDLLWEGARTYKTRQFTVKSLSTDNCHHRYRI